MTALDDARPLTDALSERDALALERNVLKLLVETAGQQGYRYSRSEVRYLSTVDVSALQQHADDLARRYRELDTVIQQTNWQVELIESQS